MRETIAACSRSDCSRSASPLSRRSSSAVMSVANFTTL
jgi:hypothetical protein